MTTPEAEAAHESEPVDPDDVVLTTDPDAQDEDSVVEPDAETLDCVTPRLASGRSGQVLDAPAASAVPTEGDHP